MIMKAMKHANEASQEVQNKGITKKELISSKKFFFKTRVTCRNFSQLDFPM